MKESARKHSVWTDTHIKYTQEKENGDLDGRQRAVQSVV